MSKSIQIPLSHAPMGDLQLFTIAGIEGVFFLHSEKAYKVRGIDTPKRSHTGDRFIVGKHVPAMTYAKGQESKRFDYCTLAGLNGKYPLLIRGREKGGLAFDLGYCADPLCNHHPAEFVEAEVNRHLEHFEEGEQEPDDHFVPEHRPHMAK